MKNLTILLVAFVLCSFTGKEVTYKINTTASTLHWLGKKATGQHDGFVKLKGGGIVFDNNQPVKGEFTIDMTSITDADIQDAGDNKKLVDHLKEENFFGVEKNPTASIVITKFEPIKGDAHGNNYNITADLTIKGITNQIQFPANISVSPLAAAASAKFSVDRTKWKIVFMSKSVFPTLGDKFIYDDMEFTVNLVLKP